MYSSLRFVSTVVAVLVAFGAQAQEDRVAVKGVSPGEEVVVAFNARTAAGKGCLDENDQDLWLVRTADAAASVNVGNLRKGCKLTVAVYSRNRAMLLTSVSGWKDQGGEVKNVTMKPLVQVPVMVWIASQELEEVAYRQVLKARELYRTNMTGFDFVPTFRNVANDPALKAIIEAAVVPHPTVPDASICSNVPSLKPRAYKSKTLNVYYVARDGLHRNCAIRETPQCGDDLSDPRFSKVDGNVTYIGVQSVEVLAHELGHAFGLRPVCNFGHPVPGAIPGPDNLMTGGGGVERAKLTLGQIYRMYTQEDTWGGTMIIANTLRPGPKLKCRLPSQENYTFKCPPLILVP